LYKIVKTGCKLGGGYKIISLHKMYKGEVNILSYKIKLLK